MLRQHYGIYHQLSWNCVAELDLGGALPVEENDIANGKSVVPNQLEAAFQSSSSLGNKTKRKNCKRKSKLQVKPMLAMETSIIEEEVIEQSTLFENVFPELEAKEFEGFMTSDNVESDANDTNFVQIVNNGEEESGTEESCIGLKIEGHQIKQFDFNFLVSTEYSKASRFSHIRCWLKCLHCEYRTRKHSLLTSHMINVHKDIQEMQQSISPLVTEINLLQGQKMMRMSAYEAALGNSSRNLRSKYSQRLEKQNISGSYPCSTCGKIFMTFRYLRKHQQTHQTADNTFVCDDCGKSYKSRAYLRVHQRVHLQKKEFTCNQCNFVSNINAAIHAHRQIHNSGSVLCDICGYAYTDRSTLGKHKRVHDLSRPFACNFSGCKWRFKTEVMCRAHIRAHTTQGKFRCADCGYIFRHKHHLQRHELHMHRTKTVNSQPQAISLCAVNPNEFSVTEDSDHFLHITDSVVPHALSSDLAPHLNHQNLMDVESLNDLPTVYSSNDLSMINLDYALLNVEEFTAKDDDGKHILISELKVLN